MNLQKYTDFVARLTGAGSVFVVDAGARWGADRAWWNLRPLVALAGFEPDSVECEKLIAQAGPREQFFPTALGEKEGSLRIHVTRAPACSSIYPPNPEMIRRYPQLAGELTPETTIEVRCTTLDAWRQSAGKPWVAFIKLDTQGSELNILRGAENTLRDCLAIEIEVEFAAMYEGMPLFADVDSFLRSRGFSFWRLGEICHYAESPSGRGLHTEKAHYDGRWLDIPAGSGRMTWGNALYIRDYYPGWKELKNHLVLSLLLAAAREYDGAAACLRKGAPLAGPGSPEYREIQEFISWMDRPMRPPAEPPLSLAARIRRKSRKLFDAIMS